MSVDSNDWRLAVPMDHLKKRRWLRKPYRRYSAAWDHDHCQFCHDKLTEPTTPGTVHEGYSTQDDYDWVCETCFGDFSEMFEWTLEGGEGR